MCAPNRSHDGYGETGFRPYPWSSPDTAGKRVVLLRNAMTPRLGWRRTVADKAFLHNARFATIRPIPAAFTFSGGKNFDLRTVDKVGHKSGRSIGSILRSSGRPRRIKAVKLTYGFKALEGMPCLAQMLCPLKIGPFAPDRRAHLNGWERPAPR